ncbi:MAG: hypothetical protein K2N87_11135 [Eubacterium sp.]|nr:hypothetical protein [Eubacterium sp.]
MTYQTSYVNIKIIDRLEIGVVRPFLKIHKIERSLLQMYRQNKHVHNHIWKDIFAMVTQDVSIIFTTYIIVGVYCLICSRSIGNMPKETWRSAVIQLCADSIVPTTITLVFSGFLQSFFAECEHKKRFFHIFSLVGMTVFVMLASNFHPIKNEQGLCAVILGSVILMVVELGMIYEVKMDSKMDLGISGKKG